MKKSFYYILMIINIISIIFCLINLHDISNEIIFLPLTIIIVFEFFLITKKNFIINLKLTKQITIMSITLCILFFIMLPITFCFNILGNSINIFVVIFILSLSCSLFYIFISAFSYESKSNCDTTKVRRRIMIIIIGISLLFILSTSTGFYDIDFPYIWCLGDEHLWDNWHTFGFDFLIQFY